MTLTVSFPSDLAPRVEKMIEEIEAKAGVRVFKRVANCTVFTVRDSTSMKLTKNSECFIDWAMKDDPKLPDEGLAAFLNMEAAG